MRQFCSVACGFASVVFLTTYTTTPVVTTMTPSTTDTIASGFLSLQTLPQALTIKAPSLTEPKWLTEQNAAERAAQQAARLPSSRIITYEVATKGMITADIAEFRSQANATLNDSRGWARMGVAFKEVSNGGMFTLTLSEANLMTSFAGCSVEYSCRSGHFVVINQDRWLGATSSWNQAGGSLRDYRHMVINHETGHWLGHDHEHCGGPGQPAPVMQQQSIDLQGCTFNPWPLKSELWSTQLGIQKA